MRLKLHHTPYVSRRITRDLISCSFVEVRKEKASIEEQVERILDEDIEKIEEVTSVKVGIVSTSPERDDTIIRG